MERVRCGEQNYMVLIIILVIIAAATGILWNVLEFAFWVAAVIFIALAAVAAGVWGWTRRTFSRR